MKHANVTNQVIAGCYTVYNTLGYEFLFGPVPQIRRKVFDNERKTYGHEDRHG